MKLRKGFVSNSSSSSFIIVGASTIDVAKEMIGQREHNKKNIDKLLKDNQGFISDDTAITFASCNYDTYIWRRTDKKLQVNTCNNESWNLDKFSVTQQGDYIDNDDYKEFFWDLDNNILVSREIYTGKYCKLHYDYDVYIFDKTTKGCPQCYKGQTFTQYNQKKLKELRKLPRKFNIRSA
jgi:hypothetical protein